MSDERLRKPPSDRFAGPTHLFSLTDVLRRLRAEDHPARDGHRQITLLHRGDVTQVLFSFEAGGHLDRHSARGLVSIHVLEGRLSVGVDGKDHHLGGGEVIVLDPGLEHDVRASEESAMLLTVHMNS
jgi:quercetin dioxygenase-like cupin family protein